MEVLQQRLPADKREGFPAAGVTFLQPRLDCSPAGRLDFQTANAPVNLPQNPVRRRDESVLFEPARFPAAMPAQHLPDFRISPHIVAGQFLEHLEPHPCVARRGQITRRLAQRLHVFSMLAATRPAPRQPEDGAQFLDFPAHVMNRRRPAALAQPFARRADAFAANAPHGFGRRFGFFETERHVRCQFNPFS